MPDPPPPMQEGGGAVQRVMQQYTRLVLLTVEVIAALKLPCAMELADTRIQAPTGYTLAFQSQGESHFHQRGSHFHQEV